VSLIANNGAAPRLNPSEPFICRPVAATLLSLAVALAGAMAYTLLPVAPLP
jgi:multidrug efflux pump